MRDPRFNWIASLVVVLSVAVVAVATLTVVGWVRLGDIASHTTHVQKRQLRAGCYLVAVIDDIHTLLAVPLTPSERRQQRHEPVAVRRDIAKLTHDTGAFGAIVSTLPRSCAQAHTR